MFLIFFPLQLILALIIGINFLSLVLTGGPLWGRSVRIFCTFWTCGLMPFLFLDTFDAGAVNDCCSDSAVFAPEHRTGIYLLILACAAAAIYSSFRKSVGTPVLEVFVNVLAVTGLVLNGLLFVHLHTPGWGFAFPLAGILPIILLVIILMWENVHLYREHLEAVAPEGEGRWQAAARRLLHRPLFERFPLLLLLALPLLLALSLLLILFGQQPDGLIRAFTQTYKHGFSALDHLCDNVTCGGHYLCSIAAKGHRRVVKPLRLGERGGRLIICNRQLLVSNAFEELVAERAPRLHRAIRRQYNKVGNAIHRHYHFFNNKWVSDAVYVLMKPLEWTFVLFLYTFDRMPERRIARQYLPAARVNKGNDGKA